MTKPIADSAAPALALTMASSNSPQKRGIRLIGTRLGWDVNQGYLRFRLFFSNEFPGVPLNALAWAW